MRSSAEFRNLVGEAFGPLGFVAVRSMFGGAGVYCEDTMFALIADDVLYLRVDDQTRPDFEREGLAQFVYHGPSKIVGMPYCEAPPSVFSDRKAALMWGTAALAAAKRSGSKKRKR